jgi:hypothetical protein
MEAKMQILRILDLRPNNWYINRAKLDRVREAWRAGEGYNLPPVLVTHIDGEPSLIDGHARAYAAFEKGRSEIKAIVEYLGDIEGSRKLYEHIHREGPDIGVRTVADLAGRIVEPEEHKRLWIDYCDRWLQENGDA